MLWGCFSAKGTGQLHRNCTEWETRNFMQALSFRVSEKNMSDAMDAAKDLRYAPSDKLLTFFFCNVQ